MINLDVVFLMNLIKGVSYYNTNKIFDYIVPLLNAIHRS